MKAAEYRKTTMGPRHDPETHAGASLATVP